jgi:hypothetical protein
MLSLLVIFNFCIVLLSFNALILDFNIFPIISCYNFCYHFYYDFLHFYFCDKRDALEERVLCQQSVTSRLEYIRRKGNLSSL